MDMVHMQSVKIIHEIKLRFEWKSLSLIHKTEGHAGSGGGGRATVPGHFSPFVCKEHCYMPNIN